MNEQLSRLVKRSLDAISRDTRDEEAVPILTQLLRRFQQERRGFVGGVVDDDILSIWGPEVHAVRVEEEDVREIVRLVAERARSLPEPSGIAAGLLSSPEVEDAVGPILMELDRLRPDEVPQHDMMAATLLNALTDYTFRADVVDAVRGFFGKGIHAGYTARSLAEFGNF